MNRILSFQLLLLFSMISLMAHAQTPPAALSTGVTIEEGHFGFSITVPHTNWFPSTESRGRSKTFHLGLAPSSTGLALISLEALDDAWLKRYVMTGSVVADSCEKLMAAYALQITHDKGAIVITPYTCRDYSRGQNCLCDFLVGARQVWASSR